jgi:transcriptional regulator
LEAELIIMKWRDYEASIGKSGEADRRRIVKPKAPAAPATREETVRRQLIEVLHGRPLSAREISGEIGIPEKEVGRHLEHIRRSLHGRGEKLKIIPAACRRCGFIFSRRERPERPGRCPVCRGESILDPRFLIE